VIYENGEEHTHKPAATTPHTSWWIGFWSRVLLHRGIIIITLDYTIQRHHHHRRRARPPTPINNNTTCEGCFVVVGVWRPLFFSFSQLLAGSLCSWQLVSPIVGCLRGWGGVRTSLDDFRSVTPATKEPPAPGWGGLARCGGTKGVIPPSWHALHYILGSKATAHTTLLRVCARPAAASLSHSTPPPTHSLHPMNE
jgi:hypothetical protein